MAGIEVERLVATLEARLDKFEKGVAKAGGIADRGFKRIETRGKQMEARLSALSVGKGVLSGIATGAAQAVLPLLTLGAAIAGTRAALQKFGDINDKSIAAGINPEFFQGIAQQAQLSGVEIGTVADALAAFAKNSELAELGRGKLYTGLKAVNPELLRSIQLATTQEQRIRLVADALGKTGDKAALLGVVFGDAGPKLAAAFEGGSRALDETIAKGKEAGSIVDSELIQKADDFGDKLDTAASIVDNQLKQALVNLSPVIVGLTGLVGDWLKDLNIVLDQLNTIENRTHLNPLQNRLVELENRISTLKPQVDAMQGGAGTGGLGGAAVIREYESAVSEALRLQERIDQLLGKPKNLVTTSNGPLSPVLVAPRGLGLDDRETGRHGAGQSRGGTGDGINLQSTTAAASAAAAVSQADAIKTYIDQLKFENSLLGKTELEQKKLTAVRQAGTEATAQQRDEIARLTEQGYLHEQQLQSMQDLYAELGDIGKSAIQGLVDAMKDGKIEGSELLDVLSNVLSQASEFFLNQAFSSNGGGNILSAIFRGLSGGIGGGSGIAGGALAGLRANGGPVEAGKAYVVGERRPELFVPQSAGRILPKVPSDSSAGGMSLQVNFAPVISGGSVDARDLEQRFRMFVRFEMPALVHKAVKDPYAVG